MFVKACSSHSLLEKRLSCGLWIERRSLQRNPLTRLEIYIKALKKSDLLEVDEINVFCSRCLNSIGNCFDLSPMFNLYTRLLQYIKVFWWLKPFSRYNILLHTVPNSLKAGTYKYMLHLIYVGILTSVFSFCSISQMCHMSK